MAVMAPTATFLLPSAGNAFDKKCRSFPQVMLKKPALCSMRTARRFAKDLKTLAWDYAGFQAFKSRGIFTNLNIPVIAQVR